MYDRANPNKKLNMIPAVIPVTAIIVYPLLARAAQMNKSDETSLPGKQFPTETMVTPITRSCRPVNTLTRPIADSIKWIMTSSQVILPITVRARNNFCYQNLPSEALLCSYEAWPRQQHKCSQYFRR